MKIEKYYKLKTDMLIKECFNTKFFPMDEKRMVDYDEMKQIIKNVIDQVFSLEELDIKYKEKFLEKILELLEE